MVLLTAPSSVAYPSLSLGVLNTRTIMPYLFFSVPYIRNALRSSDDSDDVRTASRVFLSVTAPVIVYGDASRAINKEAISRQHRLDQQC